MESRGRRSAADLAVVQVLPGARIEPPEGLTPAECERWRKITATKPADWFQDDTLALLKAMVRAETYLEPVAESLRVFDPAWLTNEEGLERYKTLTAIHCKLASEIKQLATSMRITQQSRYDAKAASTAANRGGKGAPKPWERSAR